MADLSQESLAAKTDVSKASINNYEQNKTYPDADVILSLCAYFQTDPTTLLLCDMEALGIAAGSTVGIADLLKAAQTPQNQGIIVNGNGTNNQNNIHHNNTEKDVLFLKELLRVNQLLLEEKERTIKTQEALINALGK